MKQIAAQKEWLILAAIVLVGAVLTDGVFLHPGNLTDLLRSNAPVGLMALAMTFVILTSGIDLSVGSTLALVSVVTALLLTRWRPDIPAEAHFCVAVLAGMFAGGLAGLAQGVLIATLRIQPFVITLAGMIGYRGAAKLISQNNRIGLGVERDSVAWQFGELLSSKPAMIGAFVAFLVLFHLILRYTVFGRYLRAVGDNPTAAGYMGLPIRTVQVAVYTLSGFMAGLAGVLMCARTRTGDPNIGVAYELDAIAMAVIGGCSLAGGKGGILGTLLGVLIMGSVTNILGLKNVDANVQYILKAVIIVLAVAMQSSRPTR